MDLFERLAECNEEEESDDFESGSENQEDETDETTLKRKKSLNNTTNKKVKLNEDDDVLPKLTKGNKKNGLFKQPTAEELNYLRETENLYNSNIFRLQIDELLSEISVKQKYVDQFDKWFKSFEETLGELPDFGEIKLSDFKIKTKTKGTKLGKSQRFINSISAELKDASSLFTEPSDLCVKFNKPAGCFTFGKYSWIPDVKTKFVSNIAVTIPKIVFYEKDYLNNKYNTKKFYYLMYLKHHLNKLEAFEIKEVKFDFYLKNEWMPMLAITPNYSDKTVINLFAVPENDTFKCSRFLPNRNNIKQKIDGIKLFDDVPIENYTEQGTIFYNSILLHDITLETNQKFITSTLESFKNIRDAIKLLLVWLTQRNLSETYESFTQDLLIYIIAYLTLKKTINKHMSSYQVLRSVWIFFGSHFSKNTVCLTDIKSDDLKMFNECFDVVVLDSTGCYNVAAFLNKSVLDKVINEAESTFDVLEGNKFNTFSVLFMQKMPFGMQFDAVLKVKDEDNFQTVYDLCSESDKFKYYGFYKKLISKYVTENLKFGLGNRTKEIVACLNRNTNIDQLVYGINLDLEHCSEVIVRGPKQFETGAEEFKKFWGSLANLRRFKDSSIHEAVYFDDARTLQDKRLIFKKILKYVLKEKLQLSFELNGDELEKIFKIENFVPPFIVGSNEEATLKIKTKHYELSKFLRDLKLPLSITAIQGISDSYSYTDIFPPFPLHHKTQKDVTIAVESNFVLNNVLKSIPYLTTPIESVIQLALHSKWPNELNALRAMKNVFKYEIAKILKEEHRIESTVSEDYIDIFYYGYIFRMRLYHPKEIALLKKDATADGVTVYKDTEESLRLERTLEVLPKVAGALNGIQQESPCFGPSTCLIKRWLRSHMIDDYHISDIVVNLLNASFYLCPEPYVTPTLPQIAFLRFLKNISEFDFNLQPVVVNFNRQMKNDELNEIETKFLQNRQNFNSLHIIMPYDDGKSVFTKHFPSQDILRRIKFLAGETYKYFLGCIEGESPLKYKPLFIPNMDGFDVLIYLKPHLNPRRHQNIIKQTENVQTLVEYERNDIIPIVDFNPVDLYLKDLRKNYEDFALFFHDFYGGNVIGVLWKEKVLEPVDFKISSTSARKISSGKLELNINALIEDFYTLGNGLVKTIEIQKM